MALSSAAARIGSSAHTLNEWVKKAEVDNGGRAGILTDVQETLKEQEREIRESWQANEILRKASVVLSLVERSVRRETAS